MRSNFDPDAVASGDPGRIRTCDLQLRRLLLYPLSYGAADAAGVTVSLLYRIEDENAQ